MILSTRRCAQLGLLGCFTVLAASVATLLLVPRYSHPLAVADVGTPAPEFSLRDTSGRPVSLADLRGRTVVLFFSALDCPVSQEYNERIDRLARGYAGDGRVSFLALNVGQTELDPFLVKLDDRVSKRHFPTLLDQKGSVATRYSAATTPMIVVIDPHGVVRYRGPFDNNADSAFVTRTYCAEAVRGVLDATGETAVAQGR